MDIYFVRHGQTDGNVARRHQHPDIELNEMGKLQVARLAKLIKGLKPTHLITSTNKRAMLTAVAIGRECDLIPETYPNFEEMRRPNFLIGKRFLEWTALKYVWGWLFGLKTASMHDGESYDDFLARILAAKAQLAALPKQSKVVVVSHTVFINFFLEHMRRPEKMGIIRATLRFFAILRLKNTAVTKVTVKDGSWRIADRF
jgi:broad specificity phosphatase PhoE